MIRNDEPEGAHVQIGRLRLWSGTRLRLLDVPPGRFRHVTTVNAEIFVLAHEQPEYGAIVRQTCCCVDGRPLQWIARWRHRGPVERHPGSDFIWDIARLAPKHGWRMFLLGATATANLEAQRRLAQVAPGLVIDGHSPPFDAGGSQEEWSAETLRHIQHARPTHLLVALGPPRQEHWIAAHRATLVSAGVRFAAGVGGSIDFVADVQRRAPRWMQHAGLEWLHRVIHQPSRWRRTVRLFRLFRHLKTP